MYNYKRKSSFSDQIPTLGRILLKLCVSILIGYFLFYLLKTYILYPHRMTDSSMAPSIKKDERIFLSPLIRESSLNYDKMVFALIPGSAEFSFAGRIQGKPGDRIQLKSKKVFRNGSQISSRTVKYSDTRIFDSHFSNRDNTPEYILKEREYFILCDNRDQCMDSREYGSIELNKIIAIKLGK